MGGLVAGRYGWWVGGIGPIMFFSLLELEMMGCPPRVRLSSLGSRGGPSTLCPQRKSLKEGQEKEGGNGRVLGVPLFYML